jgi:hypothetical protein
VTAVLFVGVFNILANRYLSTFEFAAANPPIHRKSGVLSAILGRSNAVFRDEDPGSNLLPLILLHVLELSAT